jgi:N-acetylneuraminic acid mutarotase
MIVYGGYGSSCTSFSCGDGAAYKPETNTWRTIKSPTVDVPTFTARYDHSAVWAGGKMIVFGGRGTCGSYCVDAAAYDPVTDTWTALTAPIDGRYSASAVTGGASGGSAIFFGGYGNLLSSSYERGDGAILDVTAGTWSSIGVPADAILPSPRRFRMAEWWAGDRLWVWGGYGGSVHHATGASYDPATSTWTAMPGLPSTITFAARSDASAIWTGGEVILWGGTTGSSGLADGKIFRP